jgi:hypothetical protein
MPVLFIYSCECAFFSLLIGAYFSSVFLGLAILGLTGIALYALYQRFYNTIFFVWGVSLLAGIAALFWGSTLDILLGTTFIAVILSVIVTVVCFISNRFLFEKY